MLRGGVGWGWGGEGWEVGVCVQYFSLPDSCSIFAAVVIFVFCLVFLLIFLLLPFIHRDNRYRLGI